MFVGLPFQGLQCFSRASRSGLELGTRESKASWTRTEKGIPSFLPFSVAAVRFAAFCAPNIAAAAAADRCSLPLSQLPVLPTEIAIMEWVMIRGERLHFPFLVTPTELI